MRVQGLMGMRLGSLVGWGGKSELQIQVVVDILLVDLDGRPCATPMTSTIN